ncbi:putative UDP-glucose glucosyltransferase [Cucumis sativus]|uniref:putative UDP-glucose glucosyltransferase n=1 Tax=Cucumis sativus TaxID=3659 RepID=UPI0002B46D54|nr:putative UDP-glucose glucosyltransferase [Cucumis sativus]
MPAVSETPCHVFLVTFPGQGHMNPTIRLGKKLASKGVYITISTTLEFGLSLKNAGSIGDHPSPVGSGFIDFEFWDDGWELDDPRRRDLDLYMPQLQITGKPALSQMLRNRASENRPVSCVIGNPFVPWVCDVANDIGIPCSVLWVQSCSVFSIYYHFSRKSVDFPSESDPYCDVQLPSLPSLKHDEIPSFLHPHGMYKAIGRSILQQFRNVSIPFCILMDTFEELERDVIKHMSTICPVKPIGPLFKTLKISDDNKKADLSGDFLKADDCFEWLDSKPPNSVVYISFGSIVHLSQKQIEEMAHALCNSGFSFLWVMKPLPKDMEECLGLKQHVLPDGFLEKAGERAKIVKWSPQQKVLSHPSIACFVTHCGWNSSVEALSSGVPVLVLPQWGDQVTNAKFLVEEYGVGIRLGRGESEKRLVERDEFEQYLRDAIVGQKAKELRENALKWKIAAEKAAADDGPSESNIEEFVEEIKKKKPCGQMSDIHNLGVNNVEKA